MITAPEQLTPELLTNILNDRGFLDRGSVTSVANLLTKELPVSVVSRVEISYSADATVDAPTDLFLKMSAKGLAEEHCDKEVEFYTHLASEMPDGPFIRCYAAKYSPETHQYYLLLEDLSESHTQSESPVPPSAERSIAAVEALAGLHAHWWEHSGLGSEIGSLFDEAQLDSFVTEVERSVIAFMNFLGDELSPQHRKMYEQMLASRHQIWGRLTDTKGLTVTHGDVHWWNFLYPRDGVNDKVRLFDWQLWHIDLGARDLAFLVAGGGFAERRPEIESALMQRCYDNLVTNGVSGYTWETFLSDYCWSAIRNLNMPVIQWSQGKSRDVWWPNLERATAACGDLNCSELIQA